MLSILLHYYNSFILVNCPPGSQGITGLTCTQCTANTFQDQQGQAICKSCPNGQGTKSDGAVKCTGENNCNLSIAVSLILFYSHQLTVT